MMETPLKTKLDFLNEDLKLATKSRQDLLDKTGNSYEFLTRDVGGVEAIIKTYDVIIKSLKSEIKQLKNSK